MCLCDYIVGSSSPEHRELKDYPAVLMTNYKIWPAVQAINFTFVPLHLRIVTVNLVAIFWNTYLAWMSEKSHEEEPSVEHKE